jgi:hypothetical protein
LISACKGIFCRSRSLSHSLTDLQITIPCFVMASVETGWFIAFLTHPQLMNIQDRNLHRPQRCSMAISTVFRCFISSHWLSRLYSACLPMPMTSMNSN